MLRRSFGGVAWLLWATAACSVPEIASGVAVCGPGAGCDQGWECLCGRCYDPDGGDLPECASSASATSATSATGGTGETSSTGAVGTSAGSATAGTSSGRAGAASDGSGASSSGMATATAAASSTSGAGSGGVASSSSGGANIWTACETATPFANVLDAGAWAGIPSFLIPYTSSETNVMSPVVTLTSNAELSATVQTAWDAQNLYVLVNVTTDLGIVDYPRLADAGLANLYSADAVEMYVDGEDTRLQNPYVDAGLNNYDAGDYQFAAGPFAGQVATNPAASFPNLQVAQGLTAAGYATQWILPFTSMDYRGQGRIGFDVAVDANDGGGLYRFAQLIWSGDGNAYLDASQFGQLYLSDAGCK